MIAIITNALINLAEKELINHEPAIQEFVIQEIEAATHIMLDYVSRKNSEKVNE